MGSIDGISTVKNVDAEKPLEVFVGYDSREDVAYQVYRYSLLKRYSVLVEDMHIKQSELRERELYWCERENIQSTEFSFTRFLTPYLANYDGCAVFVDCDFLYLGDIKDLRDMVNDKYAMMRDHHDYTPKQTMKMARKVQTVYPRKNWSSMVLYNCVHPKNRLLTPDVVSMQMGSYLHRFQWLDNEDIGSIPFIWNFLVGHNEIVEGDPSMHPKAIHYTLGGPPFDRVVDGFELSIVCCFPS